MRPTSAAKVRAIPLLVALALPCALPSRAETHAVSGAHVLELTQQFLAAAPKRYVNSPGHEAAEKFIRAHFQPEAAKGDFIDDTFTAKTPIGYVTMHNLLVKFPSTNPAKRESLIVLASHYETNYWLKDTSFVGADDGACTTALLIAIGEALRAHPPAGDSVWLLFDDGEESIGSSQMTGSDQLYGVRHAAARWSADGTLPHIKAFVVADMLGWKSMKIDHEANSTPWLLELLTRAAKDTGHSAYLRTEPMAIEDDHIPFRDRGVPVLDVIAYEYGPFESSRGDYAFHHTPQDTFDKLSAQSLQVSADLFMDLLHLISEHN